LPTNQPTRNQPTISTDLAALAAKMKPIMVALLLC
jgi:hypothetical protein